MCKAGVEQVVLLPSATETMRQAGKEAVSRTELTLGFPPKLVSNQKACLVAMVTCSG